MGQLKGQVAVVTGGSAGIGLAIARRFVDEGAHVYVTGRQEAALTAAVEELGGNATGVPGDIARIEDLDRLRDTIAADGRKIDVLVANAGGAGNLGTLATTTEEVFDELSERNFRGTFFTVQRALPMFNDGGSIVIIGSTMGSTGDPGVGIYGATKAAVRSLTRSLAIELAPRGLRVNTLSPGAVDTERRLQAPVEFQRKAVARVPLGRAGRPDEIAAAALFLASGESSYITGVELFVDGGRSQN